MLLSRLLCLLACRAQGVLLLVQLVCRRLDLGEELLTRRDNLLDDRLLFAQRGRTLPVASIVRLALLLGEASVLGLQLDDAPLIGVVDAVKLGERLLDSLRRVGSVAHEVDIYRGDVRQ